MRSELAFCEAIDSSFTADIADVARQTQSWSDLIKWLLTAYFFQKVFGATLLVNGGDSVLMSAHLEDRMLALIASPHMQRCYEKWSDGHAVFPVFELRIVCILSNRHIAATSTSLEWRAISNAHAWSHSWPSSSALLSQ